jgi:hypothetical protein
MPNSLRLRVSLRGSVQYPNERIESDIILGAILPVGELAIILLDNLLDARALEHVDALLVSSR